jgi:hypothetical protein
LFFINLPIAAIVVVLTLSHVPESRSKQAGRTPDWTGAVLATVGLGGVVFALIESSNRRWSDPVVIAALLLGIVALFAFTAVEARKRAPASSDEFVSRTELHRREYSHAISLRCAERDVLIFPFEPYSSAGIHRYRRGGRFIAIHCFDVSFVAMVWGARGPLWCNAFHSCSAQLWRQ